MIWIAHRGNTLCPIPERENEPGYIQEALDQGYDVEVDVWVTDDGNIFLGHDEPQYQVDLEFLKNDRFWCHAKNFRALDMMLKESIHCFSHDNDSHVLTSKGIIWAFPGNEISGGNTICVMPERCSYSKKELMGALGICTDFCFFRAS